MSVISYLIDRVKIIPTKDKYSVYGKEESKEGSVIC